MKPFCTLIVLAGARPLAEVLVYFGLLAGAIVGAAPLVEVAVGTGPLVEVLVEARPLIRDLAGTIGREEPRLIDGRERVPEHRDR